MNKLIYKGNKQLAKTIIKFIKSDKKDFNNLVKLLNEKEFTNDN